MDGLTVGRNVHFIVGGEHLAAIITKVHDAAGEIQLTVFYPDEPLFGFGGGQSSSHRASYAHESKAQNGTWHWIERA